MYQKLTILALSVVISSQAIAAKTYTPSQLNSMINSGEYPKQSKVKTQSQRLSFSACVSKVKSVISSISAQYPYENIVSTNTLYLSKIWTNDAALSLTCSSSDRTLVITTAKYR